MACQVAGAFGQGGEFGDEDSSFDDVELVEAGAAVVHDVLLLQKMATPSRA